MSRYGPYKNTPPSHTHTHTHMHTDTSTHIWSCASHYKFRCLLSLPCWAESLPTPRVLVRELRCVYFYVGVLYKLCMWQSAQASPVLCRFKMYTYETADREIGRQSGNQWLIGIYVCIYIYIYTRVCAHTHSHPKQPPTHTDTDKDTDTHTHTHTHTHLRLCNYTYSSGSPWAIYIHPLCGSFFLYYIHRNSPRHVCVFVCLSVFWRCVFLNVCVCVCLRGQQSTALR